MHLLPLWFLLLLVAGLRAQDEVPGPVSLREYEFDDPLCMPLHLAHEIGERLPSEKVGGDYVVVRQRSNLLIDTNGDGETDARIGDKRPKVVPLGGKDGKPWLVWSSQDSWWLGPARAWTARLDDVHVTILDGDLDGRPDGDEDWIRFGDGAFFRHHVLRLVPWGEHMAYYRFEEREGRTWLRLRKDARTPGVSDAQWQALLAFNRLRMRSGLAPTRIEPARARDMQSLAAQAVAAGYAFDRPYTPIQDRIAQVLERPILRPTADPLQAIAEIEQAMVSRLLWLGTASKGFGYGVASEGEVAVSSLLLGGADVRRFGDLLVHPAPGQVQVPRSSVAEQPLVEEEPEFWKQERGMPILVQFGLADLRSVTFRVWRDRREKHPLEGRTFRPEEPVSSALPENLQTAFFVPNAPLERHRRYWVECKYRLDYQDGRLLWSFETQ